MAFLQWVREGRAWKTAPPVQSCLSRMTSSRSTANTTPQVIVSPGFQVAIPKLARESLGIQPGQRLQVFSYGDCIELVPAREIAEMRGFLAGMDARIERGPDREL